MGDLSGAMSPQGNGRYAASAGLGMAGDWKIDVAVKDGAQEALRTFLITVNE
jgi:nitrogen fixation protein FixH